MNKSNQTPNNEDDSKAKWVWEDLHLWGPGNRVPLQIDSLKFERDWGIHYGRVYWPPNAEIDFEFADLHLKRAADSNQLLVLELDSNRDPVIATVFEHRPTSWSTRLIRWSPVAQSPQGTLDIEGLPEMHWSAEVYEGAVNVCTAIFWIFVFFFLFLCFGL